MAYVFNGNEADNIFTAPAGQNGTGRGLGGNDSLTGNTGNDDLNGNVGSDVIFQGDAGGTDVLRGGQDADVVYGSLFGSGGTLNGNRGQDLVIAASGGSSLFGGQDNDTMYGGTSGSSRMSGDLGDDVLYSSSSDLMLGGDGNDQLYGGAGNQNMFGGSESAASGSDTFFFEASQAAPAGVTAFTTPAFGRLQGGFGGADTINFFDTGDQIRIGQLDTGARVRVSNTPDGALITIEGATALNGAQVANQTILVRGQTRETLLATGANNVFVAGVAFDLATPGVNTDPTAGTTTFTAGTSGGGAVAGLTITGTTAPDDISPISATFAFRTTNNNDTVVALAGADTIDGAGGNDTINGGDGLVGLVSSGVVGPVAYARNIAPTAPAAPAGVYPLTVDDTIKGGAGSDVLTGGGGSDLFVFNSLVGVDLVTDFVALNGDLVAPGVGLPGMVAGLTPRNVVAAGITGTEYGVQIGTAAAPVGAGVNAVAFAAARPTLGYDPANGDLFYDQDGSIGGFTYVKIATIATGLAYANGVFTVSQA